MKLLLFSDLHCDLAAAASIVERSKNFDVIVGAGDFGVVRRGLSGVINVLRESAVPAILVPGNAESVEELSRACSSWSAAHVLHGTGAEVAGVAFFGVGGGVPVTGFGSWSYDFTEDEARDLLAPCPAGAVLVSHSPPRGLADMDGSRRRRGSVALLETVERAAPRLVACGHIHAAWGERSMAGATPVVNAGPQGVAWQLD